MDACQSSQARGQRADAEPKQHKSGCEDFSDYQNRAEDDPEDPDVVFHSVCPTNFSLSFHCESSLSAYDKLKFVGPLFPKILQNKPDVCRPLRQAAHEIRIPAFAIRH